MNKKNIRRKRKVNSYIKKFQKGRLVKCILILSVLSFGTLLNPHISRAVDNEYDNAEDAVYATTYKDISYEKTTGSPLEYEEEDGVDTATGHLKLSRTDLILDGTGGMDFSLTRYYNSNNANIGYPSVEHVDKLEVSNAWITFQGEDGKEHQFIVSNDILKNHTNALNDMFIQYKKGEAYGEDSITPNTQRTKVTDNTPFHVYGIGCGWAFDFPWIETISIEESEKWAAKPIYLHLGSKGSMAIKTSADSSTKAYDIIGLDGYDYNDMKLEDINKTVDGIKCRYLLRDKTGLRTYFNSDGVIVLQKDAHDNTIIFSYRNKIYFDKIIDSVGREICFHYGAENNGLCFLENVTVKGEKTKGGVAQKTITYNVTGTSYTPKNGKKIYGSKLLSATVDGTEEKYTYRTAETIVNTSGFHVAAQRADTNQAYLITGITSDGNTTKYEYRASTIRGSKNTEGGQKRDVVTQFYYVTREYEQDSETGAKANGIKYDYYQKQDGKNELVSFADGFDEIEIKRYGEEGIQNVTIVSTYNPETYKNNSKYSDYAYKKSDIDFSTLHLKNKPKNNVSLYIHNSNKLLSAEVLDGNEKSETLYEYDNNGKGSLVVLETQKEYGENQSSKPVTRKQGYTYDAYRNILTEISPNAYLAKNQGKEKLFTANYTYFNINNGYPNDITKSYVLNMEQSREYYLDETTKSRTETILGENQVDSVKTTESLQKNNAEYKVISVSETSYNANGNVVSEKYYPNYAENGTSEVMEYNYTYNAYGQQTKEEKKIQSEKAPEQNCSLVTEEIIYDSFGNELTIIDANGMKNTYTYNEETGEEESSIEAVGTQHETKEDTYTSEDALKTMTIDKYGRCSVEIMDAFGNTITAKEEKDGTWTESDYDYGENNGKNDNSNAEGLLVEERVYEFHPQEDKVLTKKNGETEYNYDIGGKGEKILAGNRYIYDEYGEEIVTASFLGGEMDAAHCEEWTLTKEENKVEDEISIQTSYTKQLDPSAYQQEVDKDNYYNQFDSVMLQEDITKTVTDEEGNIKSQRSISQSGNDRQETETSYQYDLFNRKIKENIFVKKYKNGKWLEEKESQNEYQYDCFGNVIQITRKERKDKHSQWEVQVTKEVYNEIGQKIASYDSKGVIEGYATMYEYDLSGRLVKTTIPVNIKDGEIIYQIVENIYDNNGKLIETKEQQTDAVYIQTQYQYDIVGNLILVVNSTNNTDGTASSQYTQYLYDNEGNKIRQFTGLTKTLTLSLEEGDGKDSYTYMGQKYHVEISGKAKKDTYSETKYEYNEKNQLISETDPEGNTQTYSYDIYDNLIKTIDRKGNIIKQVYDYQNRLVKREAVDKETKNTVTHTYAYNKYGNISRIDNTVFEYDTLSGQVTKETTHFTDTKTIEKTYAYDTLDNISAFAVSVDGKTELSYEYDYDPFSRLAKVIQTDNGKNTIAEYTYDANGNMTTKDIGVGTVTYTYNVANLPVSLENKTGSKTVSSYQAAYNRNGQKMKETSKVLGTDSSYNSEITYTYDTLGRLIKEEHSGEDTIEYIYDSHNNRKEMIVGKQKTAYKYNKNEELLRTDILDMDTNQDSVTIYKNDKNGNQLAVVHRIKTNSSEPTFDLDITLGENRLNNNVVNHYDALNQLTETLTKNYKIKYEYDSNGLRTKKTVNGKETIYVWDNDQIVMELDGQGNVKKRYIRGNELIYTDKGEGTEKQYYVMDLHGNVTQMLDKNGNITKTYNYDAFGNEVNPDKKDDNPFRYCGEYYDKETESVYLRARYYRPALGRFTTRDTYTGEENEPMSLHLYTYCGNDSVSNIDPSGHKYKNFQKYFQKKYKKVKPYKYDAVRVKLKGNKVKVYSRLQIVGGSKKKRKILKKGIEQKWSGTVKIKGYKVKVKTSVKTKYDPNLGDYDYLEYVEGAGTSYVNIGRAWELGGHSGKIYSKFSWGDKRTTKDLKNTVAHEFGHFLGIGDAYEGKNPSPGTDIMRWFNNKDTKMSNYDVLMFLKAAAYSEYQLWDNVKKSDVTSKNRRKK
ncbi:MAG: RHS repeat-associated core domain-containing protein [Clostridiales bacterium]|nr:RHS repeat-associated core domain-containing protein [Clostridiales bacterium]